ncbi:MAG: hypothetical protein IKP07_05635 [Bacilli bacterium]|nr:hypothetical protein [Bacilli bacterium]
MDTNRLNKTIYTFHDARVIYFVKTPSKYVLIETDKNYPKVVNLGIRDVLLIPKKS